ncbi:MAG: response regulator [Lachnospiraceae bacterium]|nr:response regulator [Lachnospiraceae bacterium]
MSDWILVVDDDMFNLRMASHILSSEGLKVSCQQSGEAALDFLADNRPDLILLDVHMAGMDGFETLEAIRTDTDLVKLPVIFLTADEDVGTETKGLEVGAMDFIRKPFVPEVLLARVHHTIELTRLQENLAGEVAKKTQELVRQQERIERIAMQIARALSGAVDAKDTYTNGHSNRVAEYAREIARRAGFSEREQNNIYLLGLLHDIGKIGIPDAIIDKSDKLTNEEYELMKTHPEVGAQILKNITEFPELATGARWHHERYDGKGYPDGLSGEGIPLEARIICVADTYDAMASRRSYRDVLPQETVRAEIEKGRGTQFDPYFADIMLQMIDEDKDYRLREQVEDFD